MARLQGFRKQDLADWRGSGITESAFGGLVGNAQTLPVVLSLLPNVLWLSGQITYDLFLRLRDIPGMHLARLKLSTKAKVATPTKH